MLRLHLNVSWQSHTVLVVLLMLLLLGLLLLCYVGHIGHGVRIVLGLSLWLCSSNRRLMTSHGYTTASKCVLKCVLRQTVGHRLSMTSLLRLGHCSATGSSDDRLG